MTNCLRIATFDPKALLLVAACRRSVTRAMASRRHCSITVACVPPGLGRAAARSTASHEATQSVSKIVSPAARSPRSISMWRSFCSSSPSLCLSEYVNGMDFFHAARAALLSVVI